MLKIEQAALRRAIRGLRSVYPSGNIRSALPCVRLFAIGRLLRMESFSQTEHLVCSSQLAGDPLEAAVNLIVPLTLLDSASRAADAGTFVTLRPGDPAVLAYEANGVSMELPLPPHAGPEFPELPIPEGEVHHIPREVMALVPQARVAAADDGVRPVISSVLLGPTAVVATDGKQLYRSNSLRLPIPGEGFLLPNRPFLRQLGDDETGIQQWTSKGNGSRLTAVKSGSWLWVFPALEGYPNYQQVIPRPDHYHPAIRIDEEAAGRMRRLLPTLGGKEPVRLVLELRSGSAQLRPLEDGLRFCLNIECPDLVGVAPLEVAFDRTYLLNALGLGLRELRVRDAASPLLMAKDELTFLWMPYRIDAGHRRAPIQVSPGNGDRVTGKTPPNPASEPGTGQPLESAEEVAPSAPEGHGAPVDLGLLVVRVRDLHRELGGALASLNPALREVQKRQRIVERERDALRRSLRVLRSVPV